MADFDLTGAMPFDTDASQARPGVLSAGPFLFDGRGMTADAFGRYVQTYDFGRIPPDFIVLHHTAVPSTLAARYPDPSKAVWDDAERGLSPERIYSKRAKQLVALRDYYRDSLAWDRGPHLFIDDRFIWLFTPMSAVGIHAKAGNSYTDANKRLHYSIGVEVVGYYEHVVWPAPVAANVRAAVGALCTRLGISPTYTPGPVNTPKAHAGSLSAHRDYNKPACPGAAITEAYYTSVIGGGSPPVSLPHHTVTAGPHGALAQEDRRPGALAARYYPPGTPIVCDDLTNSYWHVAAGDGFIPVGQVQA